MRISDSFELKSEALQSSKGIPAAMTSASPAKSQPLHNFNLPHLKWNKEGHSSGHHQRRRSVKSPSRKRSTSSASPVRQSPLHDSVSPTPQRHQSPLGDYVAAPAASRLESPVHVDYLRKHSPALGESSRPHRIRESAKHAAAGSDRNRHFPGRDLASESGALVRAKDSSIDYRKSNSKNFTLDPARNGVYSTHPERVLQKIGSKIGKAPSQRETQPLHKAKEVGVAGAKRSKILIKIPQRDSKIEIEEQNPKEEQPKIDKKDEGGKVKSTDDETKIWNLRPRKPIRRSLNVNGGTRNSNGLLMQTKNRAQSPSRNVNNKSGENGSNNGGGAEKKEKRKLNISVPLTKEEIEEDIFALTGSKPARRPKKRPKNIQKQLDSVFPGLWLVSITEDSYKVPESFLKA